MSPQPSHLGASEGSIPNAQLACDLYDAVRAEKGVLERIGPVGSV